MIYVPVFSPRIAKSALPVIFGLMLTLFFLPGVLAAQGTANQQALEAASTDRKVQQTEPEAVAAGSLDGAELFRRNCMACHMAEGEGAQGAGRFPALANNQALTAAGYPIYVVLNGLGGMPSFNGILSDEEIAAVVTYVRTHFGNQYNDIVKPDDVALMRGPVPQH